MTFDGLVPPEETASAVTTAFEDGYRLIDTEATHSASATVRFTIW